MAPPLVESRKSNVLDEYNGNLSFAHVDVPSTLVPFPLIVCAKISLSYLYSLFSLDLSLFLLNAPIIPLRTRAV